MKAHFVYLGYVLHLVNSARLWIGQRKVDFATNEEEMMLFDKDRVCAACGHVGADICFCGQSYTDYSIHTVKDTSYMERKCRQCGYVWKELPLYKQIELSKEVEI